MLLRYKYHNLRLWQAKSFFINFTYNLCWPKVAIELLEMQTTSDHLYLVTKAF